jgi:biopolymer transport protein ExbB
MMLPIVLCSFVAVAIIIDRHFFFRRIGKKNRAEEIIGLVRKGQIEKAMRVLDEMERTGNSLPMMKVLYAGITHPFSPGNAMEAAAAAEVPVMKRGLAALDTIITLSPLLGLLGTIIGMINSFNVMAASGLGQPHAVTGGVAEALICTAAGISVAVVALIPYNYFLARIERETDVIEATATRLEAALGTPAGSPGRLDAEKPPAALHGSVQGALR